MTSGWVREPSRHSMARMGIKTRRELRQYSLGSKFQEDWELLLYPQYWNNEYFSKPELKILWKKHENDLRLMAKDELKRMGDDKGWIVHRDVVNHLVSLASDIKSPPDVVKQQLIIK